MGAGAWWRRGVAVAVAAAVASPLVTSRDSAPLSTYPVYASARGREAVLHTAVGVDADGAVHRLSLDTIAGTDDPLIAEQRVEDDVRGGRAGDLCAAIAARLGDRFATVEVVAERHDVVDRAAGRDSLLERVVHARCEVPQ